jgi:hypothetical protein
MDLENGVDTCVLEWLSKDIFVELHHTKPLIKTIKSEEDESTTMEVQLKDGIPESETSVIGVS